MLKVYVKPSCILLYPYKRGQIPFIEKSLGVWDVITHKYDHFMFCFDKEDDSPYGALKIPKGVGPEIIEQMINDSGEPYTIIDRNNEYPDTKVIDVPMKVGPKNDIQRKAIEFLNLYAVKNHQALLALDVGQGKTYCTVKHISDMKKTAMIISYNLSYQWQDRITGKDGYTKLINGTDVINIVGTQYLEDCIHGKERPNAKIYLVTIGTLSKLIELYGYEELQKVADALKIGIKVFDEAHTRYKLFNAIDLNMQVDETIYLTATPGRSKDAEDRMYNKIYAKIPRYGEFTSKMNMHYIINYIMLDSHATSKDRLEMKTARGLSSLKYTRFLMDKYFDQIMQLIMRKFEPILKEDDVSKVLIVTDWLQDIQAMRDWFKRRYKQYSCGTYCMLIDKKAEREKQLEARIIIGTVGSMQNGKDIPNLRAIFPLTQFSSTIVARQLLGRLRPIKDKHVFYWDICDRGVYDTIRERKSRDSVFRERAANEIREEFIDLARY